MLQRWMTKPQTDDAERLEFQIGRLIGRGPGTEVILSTNNEFILAVKLNSALDRLDALEARVKSLEKDRQDLIDSLSSMSA